jgi:hypothetical protein
LQLRWSLPLVGDELLGDVLDRGSILRERPRVFRNTECEANMSAISELPDGSLEEARYASAWRRYKVLRLLLCFLGIGWLPFAFGIITLTDHWNSNSITDFHVMVAWFLLFLWIIAACVVGTMSALWPCPRCGKLFRGWFRPFLPKRCVHCGLARWASRGDQY